MTISKQELQLVAHLRQNSRTSLTKLSRKTGIPISTIFDKIKKQTGTLIHKHISIIDFQQLGFRIKVSGLLQAGKKDKISIGEYLQKTHNINNLARINNGYDYLFEALFHNLKELEQFSDALNNKFTIKKKELFYVIEELKKETFMSDPQLVEYFI